MTAADTTPDATPVPLRQRPIPDQLDYYGDKLAAQMDTQTVPRDALIAMGAAIVGMGHIATVLRKQAAPASAVGPDAARLAQIRDRNQYLREIPFDTHGGDAAAPHCPPCELVRGVDDVTWLLERLDAANERAEQAEILMRRYQARALLNGEGSDRG